jgi:hypothetical protein
MFLVGIPVVGFILLLVWAFSSDTNPSKSGWARASLIWGAIITVIYIIVYVIVFLIAGVASVGTMNFNL